MKDEDALKEFLHLQTKIRADDFFEAGRKEELPFDAIYRNLQKAKGDRGLSNSEAALVAGLWGAFRAGAEIAHLGLSTYFPMRGEGKNLDKLRDRILASDALLISGPVYFGDRGSMAQEFLEFLRDDPTCRQHIINRVYGGISVGANATAAKRRT